ncbi:MAG TPA: hypothetical protein VD788_04265 [Candidatus Polarisedimenticolaceae bacterium]|nr:hypothetical protein [Candidatus Polarisedimenticolaceae bacterium]
MEAKANQQRLVLFELIDNLARNWWTVVAGFSVGLSVAVVALHFTPKVYEAAAQLDITSEQLPDGVIADTVPGDPATKLTEIRQNVMSERNLDRIITEEFGESPSEKERDALRGRIRSGVRVTLPRWEDYVQIAFQDADPYRAARIANLLATFYVDENLKFRQDRASVTAETFEKLAAERWTDIQRLKRELETFDAGNPYQNEAQRPINQQALEDARLALDANLKAQAELQLQIDFLEADQAQAGMLDSFVPVPGAVAGSGDAGLSVLEIELQQLLIDYSENHPAVRKKKAEIERYEKQQESQRSTAPSEPVADGEKARSETSRAWDVQIASARAELNRIKAETETLRSDIAKYQRRLSETPGVERRREELVDEIDSLTAEYRRLRENAIKAGTSELVEQQGQGDQFQIIAGAAPPSNPIHPRPLLFYGVGIAVGLLLFSGPVLGRTILAPVVSSEARILETAAIPVLVSIPSIPTPTIARRRRLLLLRNVALSLLSSAVLGTVLGLKLKDVL